MSIRPTFFRQAVRQPARPRTRITCLAFTSTRTFASTQSNMVGLAGMLSNRYKLEDIPDLSGKVAIVTGGSAGIGAALVTALAKKNCEGGPTRLAARQSFRSSLQYTSSAPRRNTPTRPSQTSRKRCPRRLPSLSTTKSTSARCKRSRRCCPLWRGSTASTCSSSSLVSEWRRSD